MSHSTQTNGAGPSSRAGSNGGPSSNGAGPFVRAAAGPVKWLDDRAALGGLLKKQLRKAFPDHWSFMLGEIALWSFVILLLTGTFLTLWFVPSAGEVTYHGSYVQLRGLRMSEAYESTLKLSFDVRGGLLMRQMHHWAANIFIAAMTVHMLRIFFTGAFRKPRELNWLVGLTLLMTSLIEGFAGYSLPDDLMSGTGLRFVDGLIRSIPVVGTYLEFFIFGGQFPGDSFIPRLYIVHVLLIPGLLLALISVHMLLLVYAKHTQWPGPGRTERNVVGYPLMPVYMAKAGGFFFMVFGLTALMGAFMQINPVWRYGPYNPSEVTAGSQPDWYMGWVEGAVRIMPNWETRLWGYTLSWNIFIPGALLIPLLIGVLAVYPFIEAWVIGDKREHHLLQRPRNQPVRTGLGAAGITFYGLLWIGGGNDIVATHFNLSVYQITWFLRIAVFVLPIVAFLVVKRICIGLQKADREELLHGYETGVILRSPEGGYSERHAPVPVDKAFVMTAHDREAPLELPPQVDANGVEAPGSRIARLRARASKFYFQDVTEKPTRAELEEAHSHNGHVEEPLEIEPPDFTGTSEIGAAKD